MNNKKTLILTLTLLWGCMVWATPVSQSQALKNAQAFLSARGIAFDAATARVASRAPRRAAANTQAVAYYVFNDESKFVVASGDDTMPAVLGYSTDGAFDTNNISPELQALLDSYAMVADGKAIIDRPSRIAPREPIAPLVKARWNQRAPWNNACPLIPGTNERTVTGCAATAMAQVMSYHRWPDTISATIPGYTTSTHQIELQPLTPDGYPGWANIKDYYACDEVSGPAADDVAKLMLYVGQSIRSNYANGTGASPSYIPGALINYFGYSRTAHYANRAEFGPDEWHQMVYKELAEKRPIVYFGFKYDGGGHGFVCDGCDGTDMYHINWGWFGRGDGYFLLTSLNPSEEGVGSAVGDDGYCNGTGMIIGIEPDHGQAIERDPHLSYSGMRLSKTSYSRTSSNKDFTRVAIGGHFANLTATGGDFDIAYALFDKTGNEMLQLISGLWVPNLNPNYEQTETHYCTITKDIPAGDYLILAVSCLHDTEQWEKCYGAEANGAYATITKTKLTLSYMGNAGAKSYKVNSVEFKGSKQVNRPVEVVANVTNTGKCTLADIHMLVNGKAHTSAPCILKPDETGDLVMHFQPDEIGQYKIVLATDEYGRQQIYSGTVNIGDVQPGTIEASAIDLQNANNASMTITGGVISGTATVTNKNEVTYNDEILVQLCRRDTTEAGVIHASRKCPVNIANGESQTISFSFDDIQMGEKYKVVLNYYDNGELVKCASTDLYTILDNITVTGDVDGDSVADIKDLNILVNIVLGQQTPEQYPNADINGDDVVDILDVNLMINLILGI